MNLKFKKIISRLTLILVLLFTSQVIAKPLIIAHRGGKTNWPENTIYAFEEAQKAGVDAIELDVQVTHDGVPVVYHARDLAEWTNGSGQIAQHNLKYIKSLNAAWNFNSKEDFPFRKNKLTIPTLNEALQAIKTNLVIIDLKSEPEKQLIESLIQYIPKEEWQRLVFYSTNPEHLHLLKQKNPNAVVFEDRKITRQRLLMLNNAKKCDFPGQAHWVGFELQRKMKVVEEFSLGQDTDEIDFQLWNHESMNCFKKMLPKPNIVLFGIDNKKSYKIAKQLGVAAVYTNDPLSLLEEK